MLNSFQHTKYDSSNVTVYEIGCTRALSNHYADTVSSFLKLLCVGLVVELSLTVAFRYLQTSTGAAIEDEDMDAETQGYLWTVSKKPPAQKKPAPTAKGGKKSPAAGKKSPAGGKASASKGKADKGRKSPAAGKASAEKKSAASAAAKPAGKDKNRNNPATLSNNSLGNYNNMAVDRVGRQASFESRRDGVTSNQASVTRMASSATGLASHQTSATYDNQSIN